MMNCRPTASGEATLVVCSAHDGDVGVLVVGLHEVVEVVPHEAVVALQDLHHVSASLGDVSTQTSAEGDVGIAVDEDLDVEELADALDERRVPRRRRRGCLPVSQSFLVR